MLSIQKVERYVHDLAGDIRDFQKGVTTSLKRLNENTEEICREIKRARREQDKVQMERPSLNEEQRRGLDRCRSDLGLGKGGDEARLSSMFRRPISRVRCKGRDPVGPGSPHISC